MLPFFIETRWDNYGVSPEMRLWKCSSAPKEHASSWTTRKMAGKGFAFIISTMVTNYDAQYGHWLGVLPICVATTPGHEILCYSYYINGARTDVTVEDISKHLKLAAGLLNYPTRKGIPVERVDTHSLWGGGANALALSGYSETAIQKMGRWKGATFKEYIREELANYADGMSTAMKTKFNFMNVAGNAFRDITETVLTMEYNTEFNTAGVA
jgi:hypothetical protein